jgi:hypothetical protein
MAQATVKNTSPGRLSIPAPFNVSLFPGQQFTVHGIDSARLSLSTDLNLLREKGYIAVDIGRDNNIDDQLESDIPETLNTEGNITFNIDYNNIAAIDPPTDTIFKSQLEVDNFLGSMGAAKFKHLQLCYNALPANVLHLVTFNLAAGIHRPHPTIPSGTSAWVFNTKFVGALGGLSFIGAAPSLYTPKSGLATAITITAIQAANRDPFIDVSGTPFAVSAWAPTTSYAVGDRRSNAGNTYVVRVAGTSAGAGGPSGTGTSDIIDGTVTWRFLVVGTAFLRGYYAVLNTGQTVLIHDHTDSRINVIEVISPVPTSILFIGRPSTIMRNSLNDIVRSRTGNVAVESTLNLIGSGVGNRFTYQDVTVDGFGANSNIIAHSSGTFRGIRHIMDQDSAFDFGVTPAGNCWQFVSAGRTSIALTSCALIRRIGGSGQSLSTDAAGSVQGAYFENEGGLQIRVPAVNVFFTGLVCRSVGSSSSFASLSVFGAQLDLLDTGTGGGKENEFRDGKASVPSIHFSEGGRSRNNSQRAVFKNNLAACIRIGPQGNLDLTLNDVFGSAGLLNGGGNSDVGIDILGPGGVVALNPSTNVTGTVGDVRLGGVVQTYASIPSTGSGHANSASAVRRV